MCSKVSRKVLMFDINARASNEPCRLKRKHAIRRKKQPFIFKNVNSKISDTYVEHVPTFCPKDNRLYAMAKPPSVVIKSMSLFNLSDLSGLDDTKKLARRMSCVDIDISSEPDLSESSLSGCYVYDEVAPFANRAPIYQNLLATSEHSSLPNVLEEPVYEELSPFSDPRHQDTTICESFLPCFSSQRFLTERIIITNEDEQKDEAAKFESKSGEQEDSVYSELMYNETGVPDIPPRNPPLTGNLSSLENFASTENSSIDFYSLDSKDRSLYEYSTTSESDRKNVGSDNSAIYDSAVTGTSMPKSKKISTIAKSAGKKIAKTLLTVRKQSRQPSNDVTSRKKSDLTFSHKSPDMNPPHKECFDDGISTKFIDSSKTASQIAGATKNACNALSDKRRGSRTSLQRPKVPPPEPPVFNEPVRIDRPRVPGQFDHNDDESEDSDFFDNDSEIIRNFVNQVQPIYSMEEEPLYQYYSYGITYKSDDDYQMLVPKNLGLTLDMLVPRVGQRRLWCEIPEVLTSGILSVLSNKQKSLQEAVFEVLTSEVSYLKSLDVLINLFYNNSELIGVLSSQERAFLFGNIAEIRNCSSDFLSELLNKWEESWYIQEIGDILNNNCNSRFLCYKEYCRNKPYQDKTMQKLRQSRDEFVRLVKEIEEDSECQMLPIDSFLMLPMQRITRLPLLINAIIQKTSSGEEKQRCEQALKSITNLVVDCNEAARESLDAEETAALMDKLDFPRNFRNAPTTLGKFIMKGDFLKYPLDEKNRNQSRSSQIQWTFSRKFKRTFHWILLFSNKLLVTKKRANGRYEVLEMVNSLDSSVKLLPDIEGISKDYQHLFMLLFNKKESIYFLGARTKSEADRWKSKLEKMKTETHLRVESIFPYEARRDDELSFFAGDIIIVSQIQPDGWYFGKKLESGQSGWFPGNYSCEI